MANIRRGRLKSGKLSYDKNDLCSNICLIYFSILLRSDGRSILFRYLFHVGVIWKPIFFMLFVFGETVFGGLPCLSFFSIEVPASIPGSRISYGL